MDKNITIHIDSSDLDLLIEKLKKANSLADELVNKNNNYLSAKFDTDL